MGSSDAVLVTAVGDVMVKRDDPESIFALALPVLQAADISFGNCESTYAESGQKHPLTRGMVLAPERNVDALEGTFDVMSFANNHHMDAGLDAFFNTLRLLDQHGIAACGAGANLDEARQPAIVERNGTKVAFLGYSSILFDGYAAGESEPGCAPLRVNTTYHQIEIEQPGSPPVVHTEANSDDLAHLLADVRRAREVADVVVVSPHWGLHFTPVAVAEYETAVAKAAIDAGADIVLGHHQHILKPIQVYNGKVIVHGMANFAMDAYIAEHVDSPHFQEMTSQYPEYAVAYHADYPSYPFHPLARRTMIVRFRIEGGSIAEVSFVPVYVNPAGQPEPLRRDDPRFGEVADYVREITAEAGFDTVFEDRDDDVLIKT